MILGDCGGSACCKILRASFPKLPCSIQFPSFAALDSPTPHHLAMWFVTRELSSARAIFSRLEPA